MSANLAAWVLAALPFAAGFAALAVVLAPRGLGKALRRAWRLRKRSHRQWRRDHARTPPRCPACRLAAQESAFNAIVANYGRSGLPRRPKAGPQ